MGYQENTGITFRRSTWTLQLQDCKPWGGEQGMDTAVQTHEDCAGECGARRNKEEGR